MTRWVVWLVLGAAAILATPARGAPAAPAPAAGPASSAPAPVAPTPAETSAPATATPALPAPAAAPAPDPGPFSFDDKKGECLDIRVGGRMVARYMYAFDKSTAETLQDTYKPFLHVFTADARAPITKGVGGQYTCQRGIFIGWRQVKAGGKTLNFWEMKGGQQVHQKFLNMTAGPNTAAFTSLVNWNGNEGQTVIEEERTCTFYKRPAPTLVCVDFVSKLKAPSGDVTLDGDPEHGGIHYRPHDAVERAMTKYFFPTRDVDPKAAPDLPWVAETYTLSARRYTVIDFNHPDNPKDTVFSAFRDYGRIGAFFRHDIKQGGEITVRYRFWVMAGDMPALTDIDKETADFWRGAKIEMKPREAKPPESPPPEAKPPETRQP